MSLSTIEKQEIKSLFNSVKGLSYPKVKRLQRLKQVAQGFCTKYPNDSLEVAGLYGKAKRSI